MTKKTHALLFVVLSISIPWSSRAQSTSDSTRMLTFELLTLEEGTYDANPYTMDEDGFRRVERTYRADFGTIAVPENREKPDSRMIELPFVRIRSTSPAPAEPVFWFEGGPGQSNLHTFDYDYFIEEHDHVMVGYRGVDGSVNLDCPEVTTLLKKVDDVLTDATLRQLGDAFASCWARLQHEGIDMDGYTTVEVVRDIESVRRALGYERIHLVAESFGTRLAYLYSIMYPEHIHRSLLVGANPPGRMVWDPGQSDALIRHYASLWAQDPDSRSRTTDLAAAIEKVNHDMPKRWLFLSIYPGNVKASAFAMLMERGSAALVFDTYVAAANGDPSGLWLISFVAPYIFPDIVNWGQNASMAVSADYDPLRDYATEQMPDQAIMGAPLGRFLWSPARRWPIQPIPEPYRQLQTTRVETLILSGSVDFSTPAENTEQDLMPVLPNGQHVVMAEMGHIGDLWNLQPETTRRITTSFIETGTVDTSTYHYEPMNFQVQWGYPLLAKLLLAGIVLAFLFITGLLWWLIRFISRRSTGNLTPAAPKTLPPQHDSG